MNWTKEKPAFTEDCIVIVAKWWGEEQGYDYYVYMVVHHDGYWKLCNIAGFEVDDIANLKGDYFAVIPMLKSQEVK